MARRISHQLFAELEWENLLGLDKESREIKDLCARRQASNYLVLNDAYGLRVAGLMHTETPAVEPENYSLAALMCLRAAGQPLLFVYALPVHPAVVDAIDRMNQIEPIDRKDENGEHGESDALDQVIVIAINGGRPTLDRVLPRDEALHEAALFAETLESPVLLVGNLAIDGMEVTSMALPRVAALSDEERAHCQIQALSGGGANNIVKHGAAILLIIGTIGVIAWLLWPAPRQHVAPVVATVDDQAAYYAALKEARNNVLTGPGYRHITEIQQFLTELPIVTNGWRAKTLQCSAQACDVAWERGPGATLEGLLGGRPGAKIHDDNYDKAIESITFSAASEVDPGDASNTGLRILPRLDFYEVANARASTLKDHGMEAEIGSAAPLVPVPAGMRDQQRPVGSQGENDVEGDAAPPLTAKGDWRIAGHLAFLDSVTGLLLRTGNMRLNTVDIDTDATQPRFTASGYFYVE